MIALYILGGVIWCALGFLSLRYLFIKDAKIYKEDYFAICILSLFGLFTAGAIILTTQTNKTPAND